MPAPLPSADDEAVPVDATETTEKHATGKQAAESQATGNEDTGKHCSRRLRSDAERNRDLIVRAARQVYAGEGLGASMAAVARRAGVGIATLFRRFPTRAHLVDAAFAESMEACAGAMEAALADPDPWHGFTSFIEHVCEMQALDRGFADLLTMTFPAAETLEAKRAEAYLGFAELIARAQAAGRLRADFSPDDLVVLLMANAGVLSATHDAAPDAWRRLVAYMLQAFAVRDGEPLPPAPSPGTLHEAMVRLSSEGPDT